MNEARHFIAHEPYALAMRFTTNGDRLITAGMDRLIKVWAVADWSLHASFTGHTKSVNTIDLSPDDRLLASGSSDRTVRLWSLPDGHELTMLQDRKQPVGAVTFSPDGSTIVSGWYGGRVAAWDLDGQPRLGFKGSDRHITGVAISPDGTLLATAGIGADIRLWSLPHGESMGVLAGHERAVGSLTFIDHGRILVSFGNERRAIFWDVAGHAPVSVFAVEGEDPRGIILSPDATLAAIPLRRAVELRSTADWSLIDRLAVNTPVVNGVAFSPDGQILIASGGDGLLRIFG